MKLTNYKYSSTEFALDISIIQYMAKDGSRSIVIFPKRGEQIFITFDSHREREKGYEDILRDIEEINKPIVCTSIKAEQDAQRSEIIKSLIADGPCQIYPKEYEHMVDNNVTTDECLNRAIESYVTYKANKLRESVMIKPPIPNEEVPPLKCNGCPVDDITDF